MSAKATEKTEDAAGKKKLPMPLIMGVVLLLVGLVIGKSVLGGAKKPTAAKPEKAELGISLPLDEFMVNLSGSGDHYLRVQVALGMRKEMTEEEAKEHTAPMRDAILSILSNKTLAQVDKPKDREALKEEIKTKVNEATGDEKGKEAVVKVFFTAFATQ
jgi:flagellar FliL protein